MSAAMTKSAVPSLVKEDLFRFAPGDKHRLALSALAPDALALAQMAAACREHGEKLLVICADPLDASRLAQEIPWFDSSVSAELLPDWETLPYDVLSPQEEIVSERLETLYRLTAGSTSGAAAVIAGAVTAAQRMAPVSYVGANTFFFKKGDTVSVSALRDNLVKAGYAAVKQVLAAGEFAVRGGIIDVFPMGSERPFRLDLFDDEIDSIRWFDTETQRSAQEVESIRLLPGHEFPVDEAALADFRGRWRARFPGDPAKSIVYKDTAAGVLPPGIEYYLPLFFDHTDTLADYLPEGTRVVLVGDVKAALDAFFRDTESRWKMLRGDTERPPLEPREIWLRTDEFFESLRKFARFTFERTPEADGSIGELMKSVFVDRKSKNPIANLISFTEQAKARGLRTLIAASSLGRMGTMEELFRGSGLSFTETAGWKDFAEGSESVALCVGPLFAGGLVAPAKTVILTESELYAASPRRSRQRRGATAASIDMIVRDVSELKPGDPVVHAEHGIGRYQGLVLMDTQDGPAEFLRIDYKNDAKLFVPIANLHLISRYSGADRENAPLHALGRGDWEKARRKAAEQVRDTAAELLQIYALRETREGTVFKLNRADYEAFCEGFPFEETPDQAAAIKAVISDMTAGKRMDRLVCGDVGFGKTEVALRAAFVAVSAGKQVAVLCPTTLLAEQHSQTFRDRFSAWPVQIAELSRFRTGKETAKALEGIKNGTVDIVIGTHKLLTGKVSFKRLALVIIDEEHRFGVRQKEMLKKLRAEVDVLTLTATPIPRTLSMSLEGIRDFSVIATAPERRLAVKTFVMPERAGIIREAVIRELKRGGQIYFLHNEVETIENRRSELEKLVPEARIAVAHGQMGERELERIMREFYQQKYSLLLCTTIIETGIDVPTANTIIIERADKLGLAQLHQLRGRVGRSHRQAYAYLLTPPAGAMTKQAQKRLEAIQSLESLGSGFYLAMHDLEIRGAGEMLGEKQSGEIAEVGFDLYNRMLQNAVNALKNGKEPDLTAALTPSTDIALHASALLPSDYVPDVSQRLGFYKELSSARTQEDIFRTAEALADRYGRLPEPAERLVALHRLRLRCEALGIAKIDCAETATVITFREKPNIEPMALIGFLQSRKDARMAGPSRLRIEKGGETPEKRLALVQGILDRLSEKK
jgi:transcription-repair coupling factor (superfamily II helicase)